MSVTRTNVRETIVRHLRLGDVKTYGSTLPRIGWYPPEGNGILTEVLQEYSGDAMPMSYVMGLPLLGRMYRIAEDLENGRITEHVARSKWRSWYEWAHGELLHIMIPYGELTFDECMDNTQWADDFMELLHSNDADGWVYSRSTSFEKFVEEMPYETAFTDICTAVLDVEPDAFICLIDWEGAFVYASPICESCSDPPKALDLNAEVVGYAAGSGGSPAFVLPPEITKDCLEVARAAEAERRYR